MSTYVNRLVQLRVSEFSNGEGILINRGDRPVRFKEESFLSEVRMDRHVLTAPITDQDVMSGSGIAAGRILILETDTAITVKLESSTDTGIVVKPLVADTGVTRPGVFYLEGEFTKVLISIAGTDTAVVRVGIVGQ